MLDTGDFPICESDLKIEYSGKEVNCNIMNLNENGSVYLSECTVGGTEVKDSSTDDGFYHYGKTSASVYKSYKIGDIVTYNGINFYVIENSDEAKDTVTMLKAEPLLVDEVNTYGVGHVNRYTKDLQGTAYNNNGYGAMAYYSSDKCGYVNDSWVETECTTDYAQSEVKYVVDAWTKDKFKSSDLSVDATGYKTRLITYDEYMSNGISETITTISSTILNFDPFDYINISARYWTMSPAEDSNTDIYEIDYGNISRCVVHAYRGGYIGETVRPVVTILKSAI